MIKNKHQLNESKTEYISFGKLSDLKRIGKPLIQIRSDKNTLHDNWQIKWVLYRKVCISRISEMSYNLSRDDTGTLMVSFDLSKLDYGNEPLSGLSSDQLYE